MVKQRTIYRISNWSSYNKSLVDRGRITFWLSADIASNWYHKEKSEKRGSPLIYSDVAIELCLTIKHLYKLPYRATEGFVDSILKRVGLDLKSPSYSQMNRRSKELGIQLRRAFPTKERLDIVVDSTGLRVYGEGEWKVRQHGFSKRRMWKKLHLAVDPLDHEIVSWKLTSNGKSDGQVFPGLLDCVEGQVENSFGDGAYDKIACYRACHERGVKNIAPPKKLAIVQRKGEIRPELIQRDAYIQRINTLTHTLHDKDKARKQWKIEVDYHNRSIAENAMFRFKTISSGTLTSRLIQHQTTEVAIKINILNQFTKLGMPDSYPIQIDR